MSIKIIIKRPRKAPEMIEIENTLEAFQNIVGGYIETVTVPGFGVFVCDEEGRFKNTPFNVSVKIPEYVQKVQFFGTIAFCGCDGEEFTDSPLDAEQFATLFGL